MQYELPQAIARCFFAILVFSLVAVNAKSPHFPDNTQGYNSDQDSSVNSLIDSAPRPWQLELIAQRIAEANQLNQLNNQYLNGQEYGGGYDRALRSGNEIKRQSRYRLCYFNPVSCFKK